MTKKREKDSFALIFLLYFIIPAFLLLLSNLDHFGSSIA